MSWPAVVFVSFCVTYFVYRLVQMGGEQKRNELLEEWVRSQPVTYATKAKVRLRAPLGGWVDYKNGLGSVQFVVRTKGIEVSLVRGAARLVDFGRVARFLSAPESTMWLDNIGLFGTPAFRRKCIRLSGHDNNGRVDLAISPVGDLDEAWQALLEAGARPAGDQNPRL